ncbi:hypothetical protein GpartN1_g6109.t1 [Galdieria partita]|uniref:Uncharacterized protein n=1 Tax=Galdieria partita TaxID=83374 RepID=A0A9C7USY6_9RHOD|nr:hypothetical protein GpartN1_g6109.t1 [Galdieria partita]
MYVVSDIKDDNTQQAIEQDIRKHRSTQKKQHFQEWLQSSRDYFNKSSPLPHLRVYCNLLVYGTQQGWVQAKGGVLVEDGNTKISSQSLAMDLNNGKVELSGNTKVLWPKGNISAKSCTYDLQNGHLTCSDTDGMISIFSYPNYRFFSMSPKYRIPNHLNYQPNDIESDSIFERLNHTCRCLEDNQVQFESFMVMKSNQLLLHLSQEEGIMSDEWIAKKAKVYSPQVNKVSLKDNIPKLPFSIQAKKIAYGVNDLELSGAKLCLGERIRVPYLTKHICLDGLPFGNFQVGYQMLDMDGWYITKPLMKPLWFANHRAHLHLATLISLSKETTFQDRLALAASLKWNDKNHETGCMADIIVHSPFKYWKKQSRCSDSKMTTPLMTTSLSSHTVPSYSHHYYYYSGDDKESSWMDIHENGWNRCRAHFLLEKAFKKYDGKWNIYGNWRTKVFNPAAAYLETTIEGNRVSEWRELSHCLGTSFSKNPKSIKNSSYLRGKRQWEVGMEWLKADRIQEMEYQYGLGVSDERQEAIQRTFATLEMEYLHFLWKENHSSSSNLTSQPDYRLTRFVGITGHWIGRLEKLKAKPPTARATCSIGFQGQTGKLRRKWLDFSGFSVQISHTLGALSTFLFEREEQRTALNCGIVQQLYGNCRLGVEKRWTWETACWQPMETKLSLQLLSDSYAISTSYWVEQGTAKLSCRWLW